MSKLEKRRVLELWDDSAYRVEVGDPVEMPPGEGIEIAYVEGERRDHVYLTYEQAREVAKWIDEYVPKPEAAMLQQLYDGDGQSSS